MKIKIVFLFVLLFSSVKGFSQATFEKLFSKISTDAFRSAQEVPGGGFILAGYTSDSTVSDTDAYVVRLNTIGDTIWTLRYNGPLSKKDLLYKIINTSDGNFLACGYTTSITGLSDDVLFMKISASGQIMWVKSWGGSGKDRAQDIIETSTGTIALVGYTTTPPALYFDAFFLMTNASGDTLWSRRYGTATYDDANAVRELADGGFILGGQSGNGATGLDLFLVRTNSNGQQIWSRKIGTPDTDNIESILVASDGYIMAGGSNETTGFGGDDGYVVKTDTSGNILWSKKYGGNQPDDFHRVEFTSDGGLILSGTTSSSGQQRPNMWMVRTDMNGDSIWSRTFGGENHDHGYSAMQTANGGFIMAGYTSSFNYFGEEAYVVRTDVNGMINNNLTYTSVFAILSPTDSTCGGSVQIRLLVRNWGNDTVANVPVTVEVIGTTTQTVTGIYNGLFFPQDVDTVLITTPVVLTPGEVYTIIAYTNNNNDVFPQRNSLTTTVLIDGFTGPLTGNDVSICGDGSALLTASVPAGNLFWFTNSTGGLSIASGTSYQTPVVSNTSTYYVQAGLYCPSARIPVTLTVNTNPTVDLGTDTILATGSTITLDAGSGFATYLWNTGATTQSIIATPVDTFCVTIQDTNGCSATDCVLVDEINSISTSIKSGEVTIYPNPASESVNLFFQSSLQHAVINLLSYSGQQIKTYSFDAVSGKFNINVNDLSNGIYFLSVQSDSGRIVHRLVIQ